MKDYLDKMEILERESYSLEETVLTHGFLSNKITNNEYEQEKENISKAIQSGCISSPSARETKTEYDTVRYSADIPIDEARCCFYIWNTIDTSANEKTYVRQAVWVGPLSILEGYNAHKDPGDPSESIGVTSPIGKVEIPFEYGKLIVSRAMFVDIYPAIVKRAQSIHKPLEDYLSECIYIVDNNTLKNDTKLSEIAFQNVTPAKNVSAQIEYIDNISATKLPGSQSPPYTLDQLGKSHKIPNDIWKNVFYKFAEDALASKWNDSREIYELQVLKNLAGEIHDNELYDQLDNALVHCTNLPVISIF